MFILDPQLENDTINLGALPLSQVLLMNNKLFPWIILVPKRNNIIELTDLIKEDRQSLMDEIAAVSATMKSIYWPDKMNIATIGNMVSQLHVHVIARFKTDSAWPMPVWGKETKAYTGHALEEARHVLVRELSKLEGFVETSN